MQIACPFGGSVRGFRQRVANWGSVWSIDLLPQRVHLFLPRLLLSKSEALMCWPQRKIGGGVGEIQEMLASPQSLLLCGCVHLLLERQARNGRYFQSKSPPLGTQF